MWPYTVGEDIAFRSSFSVALKLNANPDPDKFKYFGYDIGFDSCWNISLSDDSKFGKIAIIFGAYMSTSVHIDN